MSNACIAETLVFLTGSRVKTYPGQVTLDVPSSQDWDSLCHLNVGIRWVWQPKGGPCTPCHVCRRDASLAEENTAKGMPVIQLCFGRSPRGPTMIQRPRG